MSEQPRIDERYTSFKNIDCFSNACNVVAHMLRIVEQPEMMNAYWQKNIPLIPPAYYYPEDDSHQKEDLLYFVCAKVFYFEELFEQAEDEAGIASLLVCELECC
jgi:N(2)-fixation sustaining protein CowN